MPSPCYQAAFDLLDSAHQATWTLQLKAWRRLSDPADGNWKQIASNILNETALTEQKLSALIGTFVQGVTAGHEPPKAWENACSDHRFSGPAVTNSDRPALLGRASKLHDYAKFLEGEASRKANLRRLEKYSGRTPISALTKKMKKAHLGGAVIFASFSEDPDQPTPFAGLPNDSEGIRIAFGLGHIETAARFILFTYESGPESNLSLHRPSVADACTFPFFRPMKDEAAKWGYTFPLKPNPRKLKGRTELVHKQITGANLVFPYELTTP